VQRSPTGSPLITIFKEPYGEGILEDYVSKRGFLRAYGQEVGRVPEDMTVERIGRQADEGDKASIRTFEVVAGIIVEATKDILREQEIECLLLGGQISKSFSHMETTLRKGFANLPNLKKIDIVKDIEQTVFHGIMHNIYKIYH
jgi:glucokinase